jgi:hypothetical protein
MIFKKPKNQIISDRNQIKSTKDNQGANKNRFKAKQLTVDFNNKKILFPLILNKQIIL